VVVVVVVVVVALVAAVVTVEALEQGWMDRTSVEAGASVTK